MNYMDKIGKFELARFEKKLSDGTPAFCFLCRADKHKHKMSLDQAKLNGIEAKWIDDGIGGFVWADMPMNIRQTVKKFEIARTKRRPKGYTVAATIVRCADCGYSEEFYLGSGEEGFIKDLLY